MHHYKNGGGKEKSIIFKYFMSITDITCFILKKTIILQFSEINVHAQVNILSHLLNMSGITASIVQIGEITKQNVCLKKIAECCG
jgi:hypothetical protein